MSYSTLYIPAYNETGGHIIPLEVISLKGRGNLLTTGGIGNGVLDAIKVAVSFIRENHKRFDINYKWYLERDIHIHYPYSSLHKDGPSSGLGIVLAIISVLKNHQFRNIIAVSGEISLSGKVYPVFGIDKKCSATILNNISCLIMPHDNKRELDKDTIDNLSTYPVKNVFEAYEIMNNIRECL